MPFEAWERYALASMKALWHPRTKYQFWHKVELAYMRARVDFGELPHEAYKTAEAVRITNKTVKKIKAFDTGEAGFDHETAAFIASIQENLGEWESEYHRHLTSYDVVDTAFIKILKYALGLIWGECIKFEEILREKAEEHKWTLMIARTHGQFAEPTTFGHLLMVYAEAIHRHARRISYILDNELFEGKISGPVGIYGPIDPRLEKTALAYLGLTPAKAETQILQRDRHTEVMSVLTNLASTIEQMALTFWIMMQSLVGELREPRRKNQRGSSSMAWKRNPILMERLQGLPDLMRGFLGAQTAQVATPEFRDISQSIVERFSFPLATTLVFYGVVRMAGCVERMEVFPEKMKNNIARARGIWAGSLAQSALIDAGVKYDLAYNFIQRAGFMAEEEDVNLLDILRRSNMYISKDDQRTAVDIVGLETLTNLFDPVSYIQRGIEHIFGK